LELGLGNVELDSKNRRLDEPHSSSGLGGKEKTP